ncbi:MAG: type III-A CRISPR-associated RAMP protein Csm5 [Saprospiraceae bacterium]|nr:type III-A CRISPR-associated RAMP protein Csm5 [Saprospiraceae bacterium]
MQIKITTITPLHIGSGTELQGNFEYLHFPKEGKLAVVDQEKVLAILGEENLSQWIACIDNDEPLLPLLEKRHPGLKAADVAARIIESKSGFTRPLREQIRLSVGNKPILPGSSLKGALRTGLFSKLIIDDSGLAKDRRNLGNDSRGGFRWSDQPLQKTFFGEDPNHDIFRLLQVGDAIFENAVTEALKIESINKKFNRFEIKNEITQYVETIPAGATAQARVIFNELLNKRAQKTFNRNAPMLRLEELFPIINNETLRLLDDEIDYWDDTAGNPDALGDGLEEMERISDIGSAFAPNECLIRIGWGSGFRSMTGDWHGAMRDDDYDQLIKSLRPKHPIDLVYPKSMRMVSDGTPLGFVKLTLLNP